MAKLMHNFAQYCYCNTERNSPQLGLNEVKGADYLVVVAQANLHTICSQSFIFLGIAKLFDF